MQSCTAAYDAHFSQPANSQRNYSSKLTHDKTSAIRNVRMLCSNCPPHTSSKSLSPLSNSFVDDALIQLIPFVHNAYL